MLLIDDSQDDREMIVRALRQVESWNAEIVETDGGPEGLSQLRQGEFGCVLLDYSLPGNDGLAVLNEIRLHRPDLAVVMITGQGSEQVAVSALKGGASDYVSKSNLSPTLLGEAVDQARDSKRREIETLRRANIDDITGLPNRRVFNERLDYVLQRSRRKRTPFGVAYMDLDGFKSVNDRHGHEAGDQVLHEAAVRMQKCLRGGDLLARVGGDEFAAILENLPGDDVAGGQRAVARLLASVENSGFLIAGLEVFIRLSVGLAFYPRMAKERDELLRLADQAMYRMKQARRTSPPRSAAGS